jgi:predicted PurR-regulated permease PerM
MPEEPQKIIHSISTGTIIKTLLILACAALLFYIRDVILVFLTAVVLASAIEPGARFLVRRGIPRILAVILLYVIIVIGIVAISYLILPSLIDDLSSAFATVSKHIPKATDPIIVDYSGWQTTIQTLSKSETLSQTIKSLALSATTAKGSVLATLTIIFGGLTSLVLIFILSFYLSVREHGIEEFLRIITPERREGYVISLWRRTQHKIGRWLQGQLLLALIVGVLVFIGLTLLRVEHAFVLSAIITVFEIIPIFGPIIGAIPGVLAGFLQGGFTFGLIVALMYLIVQQIESNIIYPLVVKKVLDLNPLVVIIALLVGLQLGGVLGVLLSVPIAAALTEYLKDISKNKAAAREKYGAQPE